MFFVICNKNAKALTLHSVILLLFFLPFFVFNRFFYRKLGFKGINGAYIRDQEVKIYKIRLFFLILAKFAKKSEFWRPYWIFLPAILTRSKWRRKLKFGSATSHDYGYLNYEFQENRIKTLTVTVLPCFRTNMAAVTSSIMQMSQNSTAQH